MPFRPCKGVVLITAISRHYPPVVNAQPGDYNWKPADTEELLADAAECCRQIVAGQLQPGLGAARIWAAASELRANHGSQWPKELTPLIGLAAERDEIGPDQESDRLADIRSAAQRLLDATG